MARFPVAEERMFKNIWVCMTCNAKHRAGVGKKPDKCRKCGKKRFRQKSKLRKA